MAWWSLYKWFGSFRTTPFENMITWYTNKLNHERYQSLSDEEKEQYIKKAEERKRNNENSLTHLMATYATIVDKCRNMLLIRRI